MDALLVAVIVLAVLMALVGLGVVAGSGRTRRMEERRIHADELRRETDFHEDRAERARLEAEESADAGSSGALRRTTRRRSPPSIFRGRVTRLRPMRRSRALAALAAIGACLAAGAPAQAAGRCGDHPWCDRSKPADVRAGLLLAQLTLDEKLGLMGGDASGLTDPGASSGTVFGIPRLDVPPLTVNDGPSGIRQGLAATAKPATALPAGLALGASFDPRLAARYARVIAAEARRRGHDVVLGPMVNL